MEGSGTKVSVNTNGLGLAEVSKNILLNHTYKIEMCVCTTYVPLSVCLYPSFGRRNGRICTIIFGGGRETSRECQLNTK